ncbi:MAG: S41 family peptidase [Gemmatimonadaceae bacterium]
MRRFRRHLIAAALVLPLIAGAFVHQNQGSLESARLLEQVMQLVSNRFVDTLNAAKLHKNAARGLVQERNDPYTTLLSPRELSQFNAQTGGRYGGIGMEIAEVQGFVTVQKVFPHTPAEQAGVQEGDRIVVIDTVQVRGWTTTQVSDALKGTPGTRVSVQFQRPGVAEPIPVRFTRAIVHIPAVPYAIVLENRFGYIPLLQFNETATRELSAAVQQLMSQGARGIILDLRGNPGGILDEALTVSNLFLREGQEISSMRGRGTEPQTFIARERPLSADLPLVILQNGGSASGSEIVAGALQDHDRALIVGTTSFGKGLVQTVYPLNGGYALKMTTAKWFTPSGRSIQKERKLLPNGEFVEVTPDSLETEETRRNKPQFRSDAGRIVYGGGAITPDVIVRPDTLTAAEQRLINALAPQGQVFRTTLYDYARELKSQVKPDFVFQPAWRQELYRRLTAAGVKIEAELYNEGATEIDRILGSRITVVAFGDSTDRRRTVSEDRQLMRAVELLGRGQTQQDLFAIARSLAAAPKN